MISLLWTSARARGWLLVVLLITVITAAIIWAWHNKPDEVPPEILEPRVDSSFIAERAVARALDSVSVVLAAERDSVNRANAERDRRLARLEVEARTAGERAERLATVARAVGDTVGVAWSAYEAERERGVALQLALVSVDSSLKVQRQLTERYRVAYDSATAHAERMERVAVELREAVGRAVKASECRIAGLIKCPSRTITAIVGIGGGYLLNDYLQDRGRS